MSQSFGIGESYQRAVDPVENLKLWNEILDRAAKWHFNTVRLAFRFPDMGNSSPPLTPDLARLRDILDLLHERGMSAVLDLHNYLDMNGYFGSPQWKSNWLALVNAIKDHVAVVGYELFNEPFQDGKQPTWHSSLVTTDDAWRAYALLSYEIRKIDPGRRIIWAAASCGIHAAPPQDVIEWALANNIVFSLHPWGYVATNGQADSKIAAVMSETNAIKAAGFEVWNGEMGIESAYDYAVQKYYCVNLINECIAGGYGFNLWLYTRNHWLVGSVDDYLRASDYYDLIPHVTHKLNVTSQPIIGVPLTVDGVQYWTNTEPIPLDEGFDHTITVPQSVVVQMDTYKFKEWADDHSTVLARTGKITVDSTLTCVYELTTTSPPTSGFPVAGAVLVVSGVLLAAAFLSGKKR